jgi:tetratricopeptide (TPR) repeat protein/DNA-binding XRE family transcriptional regulator
MNTYEKLELFRRAYEDKKRTQSDIGAYLGVSRRTVNAWINGTDSPSQEKWREKILGLLLDNLDLAQDHQQFHNIWENVMVGAWHWNPLSQEEIASRNLEPPMALFLNVPSRPLHVQAVGREELLSQLKQRLLAQESFALTGKPGVGKTRLTIELARDRSVMTQFSDGIIWITMGLTPNVMGELTKVAEGIGLNVVALKSEAERARAVKNAIGQRRVLIVIDDVWDLIPAKQFLSFDGPHCCTVLTTRDEQIARGFFADPTQVVHVPELAYSRPDDPAHELLYLLAPEICDADPTGTQKLVRVVGGLPLALILLGGYLGAPEHHIFAELHQSALRELGDPQRRLQLAQERLGALDNEDMTLQAVIELSLEELRSYPAAYHAFYALGAFAPKPEHFTRIAAEQITGADTLALATLVRRNLLEREDETWLALHQVLADVARTKVESAVVGRHREYYLALVKKDIEDWRQIGAIYGQIRWAWSAIPEDAEPSQMLEFIPPLNTFQSRRGLWSDKEEWLKKGLQITRKHGWLAHTGWLSLNLANLFGQQGRWNEAIELSTDALAIKRKLGDRAGEASTLLGLANVYGNLERWDDALDLFGQVLVIAQEQNDRRMETLALIGQGNVYENSGQIAQALKITQQVLIVCRELGDSHLECIILNNAGNLYSRAGKLSDALMIYQMALVAWRKVGDRRGEAMTLNNIGTILEAQNAWADAALHFAEALANFQEMNDRIGESKALANLGLIFAKVGQHDKARLHYELGLQKSDPNSQSHQQIVEWLRELDGRLEN